MRQIGSQTRETLAEAGYVLVEILPDNEVIVQDDSGKKELWALHDDHAGYTLEIYGIGYEFVKSM